MHTRITYNGQRARNTPQLPPITAALYTHARVRLELLRTSECW